MDCRVDWTNVRALGPFRMTGKLPRGGFCAAQCAFTGIATGTWFALAQCLQHVQLCGDRVRFILQPTTLVLPLHFKNQMATTCKYALTPCTHPIATSVHKQHGSPIYTAPFAVCARDVLVPKANTKNARRLCNSSHQINGHQFSCDAESSPRARTRFASSCDESSWITYVKTRAQRKYKRPKLKAIRCNLEGGRARVCPFILKTTKLGHFFTLASHTSAGLAKC